jgi:hypothetical protein
MRKFIVHSRPILGSCRATGPTIVEVECEQITPAEDPSVMWLPTGEYRARIVKPDWLQEPRELIKSDGSKEKAMVSPTYHSHALMDDLSVAQGKALRMIREEFEFQSYKKGIKFTDEEVLAKFVEVEVVRL